MKKPDKGADQLATSRSLFSTFDIRFLQIMVFQLATFQTVCFELVSAAEQKGSSVP